MSNYFEKYKNNLNKYLFKGANILSISHNDMDGVGSQLVIKNCFDNVQTINLSYHTIDEVLRKVEYDKYDCVLITDISPEHYESVFDEHPNIVLIDHHDTATKYHNPSQNRFVFPQKCGTYITKALLENILNVDLSYLNDLVLLINDYDMWEHKDPRSKKLNLLFYKLWGKKFIERFFDGVVDFTDDDETFFKKRQTDLNKIYDNLEIYEDDKINACITQTDQFSNDIAERLLTEEKYRLVMIRNPITKTVSIRANIDECHVGETLKELDLGGGHKNAGGFRKINDVTSLRDNMDRFIKHIYNNYPNVRR